VWKYFLGIGANVFVGSPQFRVVEIAGEVVGLCELLQTTWGEDPMPSFLQLRDPCHIQT
jgi:hypothetical protein